MALSANVSRIEAASIEVICTQASSLLAKIQHLLEHNSDLSIDWAAVETPEYIAEDADGNINGLLFSRQDVANAVGSLDQIRKLLTNQATSQGDHLGNLNKLARPAIVR
jgi:hypothetical protein